jgi:hypothetical protein
MPFASRTYALWIYGEDPTNQGSGYANLSNWFTIQGGDAAAATQEPYGYNADAGGMDSGTIEAAAIGTVVPVLFIVAAVGVWLTCRRRRARARAQAQADQGFGDVPAMAATTVPRKSLSTARQSVLSSATLPPAYEGWGETESINSIEEEKLSANAKM